MDRTLHTPYSRRLMSWLLPLIISAELAIFLLDLLTPSGAADQVFYLLPITLAVLHWRPALPIHAAGLATFLAILGQLNASGYVPGTIELLNRSVSIFVFWCIALLVRQVIITRNNNLRQSWLKTTQSELATHVRGELSIQDFAQRSLTFLADRLSAQVGVLHVRSKSDDQFAYAAGYAFDERHATLATSFCLGEGLAGQAAAENRIVLLDDVPSNYLSVSSMLGATSIKHLVLVPLTADGETRALIELGFLQPPSQEGMALLENVTEQLGIDLRSTQYKYRLNDLLQQSQQYAEELQVQQEELSTLNEELEQQNKALKDSQLRLEHQQAELEQSNHQLEQKTLSLERQKVVLLDAQKNLKEQAQALEQASRYKSEFLANMSHELRTPLNSSLILSKLLAENRPGNLTPEQIKFAETINTSGNDLLTLINDVLDLAKVEAGKLDVWLEPFDLAQLLTSLERAFQPLAQEKGLNLQIVIEPGVPEEIRSDRRRLEQILKNFLSNAFKFTDKGHVIVRVDRDAEHLFITVEDSGIGIPEDKQATLFEAFHQVDSGTSRRYGGTGLGLSISQELAHLLGGEITLISQPAQGSSFSLQLPLVATEKESATTTAPIAEQTSRDEAPLTEPAVRFSFSDDRAKPHSQERRILIVEDDEAFARILLDLAHEMHFQALVTPTTTEAVELLAEHEISAILLDIRLPDQSGLAFLEQLKSSATTRHIPVHIVSVEDFALTARRMGAVGYMLKPVKRDALIEAFRNLQQRMNQTLKRVLVVEDNTAQRNGIVQLIEDKDVHIEAVATAEQALERLSQEDYDCMVMDLSLPMMSGYELLAELSKSDSPYSYPPVIVYTGRDLNRKEEERLRRFSNSIIIKGARSPERLLSEITLFLHRVESELPPARQKILRELRNREQSLDGARILLVDDDVRNIFALSSALEPHGTQIEIARNGREALEKLDAQPETDLVLMDIMMPEMNGLEAIQAIRQQERFQKLPIIAVTAKAMRDDQESCLRAGASDYLAKPVDMDKLLSLLRVWLSTRRVC